MQHSQLLAFGLSVCSQGSNKVAQIPCKRLLKHCDQACFEFQTYALDLEQCGVHSIRAGTRSQADDKAIAHEGEWNLASGLVLEYGV